MKIDFLVLQISRAMASANLDWGKRGREDGEVYVGRGHRDPRTVINFVD